MATQKVQSARDTYLSLMVEAKARALSISSLVNDQRGIASPLVREYGILQVRMLCEIIGLGCLVAHDDLVAKSPKAIQKAYAPGEIINALNRLHDDFFPIPGRIEKSATGWHFGEHKGGPCLTKSEISTVWAQCGDILYKGNLKRLLKEREPLQTHFNDLHDWAHKILNLLSIHRIVRADRESAIVAILNDEGRDGNVTVLELAV